MIPTSWQFGPFARGLDAAERAARCRALRTIVQLRCGERGLGAARALHLTETNVEAAELAVGALERLDALDRRHVLASYHKVSRAP